MVVEYGFARSSRSESGLVGVAFSQKNEEFSWKIYGTIKETKNWVKMEYDASMVNIKINIKKYSIVFEYY